MSGRNAFLPNAFGEFILQDYVLIYIANHPQLVHSDVYEDLPDKLKEDVEDAIAWKG